MERIYKSLISYVSGTTEDLRRGVDGENRFFGLIEGGRVDVCDGNFCAARTSEGFGNSCTDSCSWSERAHTDWNKIKLDLPVPPAPVTTATPKRCFAIDAMLAIVMMTKMAAFFEGNVSPYLEWDGSRRGVGGDRIIGATVGVSSIG
jgi:hypothetical protein